MRAPRVFFRVKGSRRSAATLTRVSSVARCLLRVACCTLSGACCMVHLRAAIGVMDCDVDGRLERRRQQVEGCQASLRPAACTPTRGRRERCNRPMATHNMQRGTLCPMRAIAEGPDDHRQLVLRHSSYSTALRLIPSNTPSALRGALQHYEVLKNASVSRTSPPPRTRSLPRTTRH